MYFFEAKTTNRKKHSTSTFTSDQDTFELVFCPGDSGRGGEANGGERCGERVFSEGT